MAANIYDWSVVAANNSNSDADMTWAEGQAPSTVNNSARVVVQRVKQLLVDIGGSIAAGGTANGLTVTASSPFAAYADGQIISFRATASNTAAATLSVNGIGAKSIRKFDAGGEVALVAGDIKNTGIYVAQYSAALNGAAGAWLLINPTMAVKAVTFQDFTSTIAWTKTVGCRYAIFEAVAGGGGGGGVDGQGGGTCGAAGGGASGAYGSTGIVDVSAISGATVTIGAAGIAGVGLAGGNGGAGGNTSITINATVYTWAGGGGGFGITASNSTFNIALGGGLTAGSANVTVGSGHGGHGFSGSFSLVGMGGTGGDSLYGTGGAATYAITPGTGDVGNAPAAGSRGAGGSGAVVIGSTGNVAGGAGSAGFMRIWEFY